MFSYIIALFAIIGGAGIVGMFILTLTRGNTTQTDWLLTAIALFVFATALGAWRVAALVEDHLEDLKKP